MSPRSFVFLLFSLVACSAHAGARDEVEASMQKFIAAKSYHASMTGNGPAGRSTELDFVAPDRYRMTTPMGTQYIIGDTMVLSVHGRSMRVPMPAGTLSQWHDPANLHKNAATTSFSALGPTLINGEPARKYRMTSTQSPDISTVMWIGVNGYPLQIEVSGLAAGKAFTTTVRYSRINDPSLRFESP